MFSSNNEVTVSRNRDNAPAGDGKVRHNSGCDLWRLRRHPSVQRS